MPILSGLDESGAYPTNFNTDVEVFTPSADMNGRGTVSLVGSRGGAGPAAQGRATIRTCSRCRAGAC